MSDSSLDELSAKITQFINQSDQVVAEVNSKIIPDSTMETHDLEPTEEIKTGPLEDSISPDSEEPETLNRIDDCFDDTEDQFQPLEQLESQTSIHKSLNVQEASTLSEEKSHHSLEIKETETPIESLEEEPVQEKVEAENVEVEVNIEVEEPENEPDQEIKQNPVNQSCEVKSLDTSYDPAPGRLSHSSSLAKMSQHSDQSSRVTSDIIRRPKSRNISALDSIEVKSVSSTTSSKYGIESKMFENTELWKFVRQFIPPDQESQVRQKLQDEMSQYSSRPSSSRSVNPLTLSHLRARELTTPNNQPVNKSGKSVVSEKRFMDGITDSPVGSHKSSTPDHSLMDGWKYTRDAEYLTGSIKSRVYIFEVIYEAEIVTKI